MLVIHVVLDMVKEVVQYIWIMLDVWEMNLPLLSVNTLVAITVVTVKMPLFNAEQVSNFENLQYNSIITIISTSL